MKPARVRAILLVAGLLMPVCCGPRPGLAQQGLAEAESALRSGRYDDAISLFSTLARRQPGSVRAVAGLVDALSAVGRYDAAAAAARRYITAHPASPELWNGLGAALSARGRVAEAADAFGKAIAGGASDALSARLNLAVLRHASGEVEDAMRQFDGFIDVYNDNPDLSSEELAAVGTALRYLGIDDPQLFKDALRAYDEAISADPDNLDARLLVGELFLEKYDSGEAAAAFADVLTLNPSHPGALLGVARRMRFDSEPGALEMARTSLEVNPNLVAGRVFVAELRLELEDYAGAVEELQQALKINPASLPALSTLAAARFIQGETRAFEEVRARVLDLNPRYADLYNKLAELSARNRLYAQAVGFARQAVELDSKTWRGYALLGINQLRTGAIVEGRRNLTTAFEGDPFDVWTKNTLDLLDTFERYEDTRTGRFIIAIDGKESKLLSLYYADLAEEAYASLAQRYGYSPPTPIRVEVYPRHADFSVRTIGLVGMGALGVSFGPVIAMDSPSARDAGQFNWGSTLWHEIAHSFHLGMTEHRVPRWFSEGLAVFEERRARPGWGDDVNPSFLIALLQDKLLPLAELNNGFARPSYPEQLMHSYYQASLVCEMIEREWGARALVEMLSAYRDGQTTDQAFRRVLGLKLSEVNNHFFSYLRERFATPLPALQSAGDSRHGGNRSREEVEARANSQPGDYFAQLAFGRVLYEEGDLERAVKYLEQAKQLFPEYTGPANPYWYLALAHKRRGQLERAEVELTALIATNERDYRARFELAEIREQLGNVAGAAAALEGILYIHPFQPELHDRLADLYARVGNWPGSLRERRAVLALNPVDRAQALYQLALAHFQAEQVKDARRVVLEALELAPAFEQAQELLLDVLAAAEGGGE